MKKDSLSKPLALLFGSLFLLLSACTSPNAILSSLTPVSSETTSLPASESDASSNPVSSTPSSSPDSSSSATSSASSSNSSSTPSSPVIDGYWAGIDVSGNMVGNAFRGALQNVMIKKGTKTGSNSYKELNNILSKSDQHPNGGVCAFYRHDEKAGSWNKEHVWPNSRGAGENAGYAGSDPQVIRPTNSGDNSSRSNYMYAERQDPTAKATAATGWDPAAFGYEGARGEAARIIFYAATRYYSLSTAGAGGTSNGAAPLELSVTLDGTSANHLMGKLDDMLRWNAFYPVTRAEKYRNDYLGGINYARNPFIDHPEWADMIWDAKGIRTSSYTPSSSSYSSSSEPASPSKDFRLVTSTGDLVNGSHYVIASSPSGTGYAIAPMMVATYFVGAVPVTINSALLNIDNTVASFVLGNDGAFYTFQNPQMGYLSGCVNSPHYNLGFANAVSATTSWSVTLASDGSASLKSGAGVYASYDTKYNDFTGSQTSATLALFREVQA